MLASPRDPERVLAGVVERRLSVALDTLDLSFVVALYLRAEQAQLSSFTEAQLEDVFAQVSAVVQPGADQVKKRGTHAIGRLRDQRMLARVDGHGVVRTGEYALSRLATAIVEFFLDDDVLTRESLTVLTQTLLVTLQTILAAARGAADDLAWHADVVAPLRVTIAELVAGIERRQRGLDLQQEDFQAEIRRVLEADWFGAIDRCQVLLESTSATLRELNEILLRDTSQLQALLHDIQDLAITADAIDAEAAALRVMEQVDRIAAWGAARQRAWSEYFLYVHRYLRDVVRLDPTRALTHRLREQLASAAGRSFSLTIAGAPPIRVLRTVIPLRERPPVARPRAVRDREPVADTGVDPQQVLEGRVRGALDQGAVALSTVTSAVGAEMEVDDRFLGAGRVAQTVAQLTQVSAAIERTWVSVSDALEIEEWALAPRPPDADDGVDR